MTETPRRMVLLDSGPHEKVMAPPCTSTAHGIRHPDGGVGAYSLRFIHSVFQV